MYIRLSRPKTPVITEGVNYDFKIGRGVILKEGKTATVIACGLMVGKALEAAEILAKEGLDVRVVNMHTIKPLDQELIVRCAGETGAIVTAEEHSIIGGLGGAVAETLVENAVVPMARVGLHDVFGESGTPDELLAKYGLTPDSIVAAVKAVIKRKR
jgi:transketolase